MMPALDHILASIDAKQTGTDKFLGHCPGHGSRRHRDLSIRITSDRILLHCFAGCELPRILLALDLTIKDLFCNSSVDPSEARTHRARRDRERQRQARIATANGLTIDALREADYFIRSRQGLTISKWSHAHLQTELTTLADAYTLLAYEDLDG
jgi:hypothetical protein